MTSGLVWFGWFGWFGFISSLEGVGLWVKPRLKGNLFSHLGFATAILPDQGHVTVSHFPQWLWAEGGKLTRVGAGRAYSLTVCQHPLRAEGNSKQDSNDFSWSFLGQKEEGGSAVSDCSAARATSACSALACFFCESFGKRKV